MNIAEYKGVWVFAEQRDGSLQKVSLELLGKGKMLAENLGVELTAVLLGYDMDEAARELVHHGADKVLYVEHILLKHFTTDGYAKVICNVIEQYKPEAFLIGATFIGRDLAPRIAARLGTGLTADCTELDIDMENRNLLMTRPAFGGNLMATIVCTNYRPQMSTVRPGVFEKLQRNEEYKGEVQKLSAELSEEDIRTKVLEVVKACKECKDIGEARIIVAGGRGLGSKEGFGMLTVLAEELGGVIAGSRAAVENCWIDKAYQVGQTGKTVRPALYIACGISGAIQHLAGMQDSDYIIAINKDEAAPIMKTADLALVGDYKKIIPELTDKIKEMSS